MTQVFREGFDDTLDTVFKLASGLLDPSDVNTVNKPKYSYSSIAKAASKLIAVFPVISSRNISSKTVQRISKFIEQKACHLFILALQQANISDAKSGVEYLRQFHQNLDMGSSGVDEVIRTMQTWVRAYGNTFSENAAMRTIMTDNGEDFEIIAEDVEISARDINRVMEAMKELSNIRVYDTELNPASINDFMVNETGNEKYKVGIRRYERLNEADQNEDEEDDDNRGYNGRGRSRVIRTEYLNQIGQDKKYKSEKEAREAQDRDDADIEAIRKGEFHQFKKNKDKREAEKHGWERDEIEARRRGGKNVEILRDQDIKKMNDAVPSLLVVRFYQSTTATVATEFIIGVKSRIIGANTPEILRRIMNDNKDGKKFLNFMRTITGELKVSEFLLGLSRMKEDLRSIKVKGAQGKIWNLLKNRADAAREQVKYKQLNDYSAITTVLISKSDADELFREENFDITKPSNALHFMDSYNLMAFGIVDDALEKFDMLFDDGSKVFEEISYTMLERETKEDATYKKLVNLMASSR